jgi:small subunit ribosomal protein S4e
LGKKGQSSGLKRKPAPRFWPIRRKAFTWVVRPTAGPHSLEKCMPLALVLRESLGLAETRKEAKTIVAQGRVYIDGNIRTKDDFPLGLMDVVSIPDIGKSFCMLPSYKGLILKEISGEDAKFKLCRIEDKTIVTDGQVQLRLHDGSNILVRIADSKNRQEDVYDTLDTVKISLPERQILEHIKMEEKDIAIIAGGKNIGKWGKAIEIEKSEGKKRRNALVTIEDEKGNRYQTILNFVFAIGKDHPLIPLVEAV